MRRRCCCLRRLLPLLPSRLPFLFKETLPKSYVHSTFMILMLLLLLVVILYSVPFTSFWKKSMASPRAPSKLYISNIDVLWLLQRSIECGTKPGPIHTHTQRHARFFGRRTPRKGFLLKAERCWLWSWYIFKG